MGKLEKQLFEEPQKEIIEQNLPTIISKIRNQKDKVVIQVRGISMFDVVTKLSDPSFLGDRLYSEVENGISILHASQEFISMMKEIIPLTIKELTIPIDFIEDITYLTRFKDLEVLNISTQGQISKEELDYLSKYTKIRQINIKSNHTFEEIFDSPEATIVEIEANFLANYKGIEIMCKRGLTSDITNVIVYQDEFSDISVAEKIFEEHLKETPNIRSITLKGKVAESDKTAKITISPAKEISSVEFVGFSATEAATIIQGLVNHFPINQIDFKCQNETYGDIQQLEPFADLNLTIQYDKSSSKTATYSEFIGMRATIDYYKSLITSYDLSPVERITYVYDLLKSWSYKEHDSNKKRSRSIPGIIEDGTIVCTGYSIFAKQILKELNIPATTFILDTPDENGKIIGHERNLIRVDDPKYNIHGLYVLDITWDSDRNVTIIEEDGKKRVITFPDESKLSKSVDRYDNQSLYRNFLIPLSDYERRYPNDTIPQIITKYREIAENPLSEEQISEEVVIEDPKAQNQHQDLFNQHVSPPIIKQYTSASKPSLEQFQEILQNVREAQGYTPKEAANNIKRIVELHEMINEQNSNQPNTFFKHAKPK